MKNPDVIMEVDIRKHPNTREEVRAGLGALLVQARQIWEGAPSSPPPRRHTLDEIVIRLMKGTGDLAALVRDMTVQYAEIKATSREDAAATFGEIALSIADEYDREIKKELGNVVFSTIRWIDDLGFDILECLDLAIEAQEKFAQSGRPR